MASFDRSGNFFQCPNCLEIDEHIIGDFKIFEREIDGNIFDADMTDGEALEKNNKRFDHYATINCAGKVSHSCLEDFARQEITESGSPLSRLFSKRIRARKCPHCGLLTKMSRLP